MKKVLPKYNFLIWVSWRNNIKVWERNSTVFGIVCDEILHSEYLSLGYKQSGLYGNLSLCFSYFDSYHKIRTYNDLLFYVRAISGTRMCTVTLPQSNAECLNLVNECTHRTFMSLICLLCSKFISLSVLSETKIQARPLCLIQIVNVLKVISIQVNVCSRWVRKRK